jgi:hypothetical protein
MLITSKIVAISFFESKDKIWYRRGKEQLDERWVNAIEHVIEIHLSEFCQSCQKSKNTYAPTSYNPMG